MFFPSEAFSMFGNPAQAFIDLRYGRSGRWEHLDPYAFDYRDVFLYENDWRSEEWVTFISDKSGEYFSQPTFARLLASDTLFLRYTATGGERLVTFPLAGLRNALRYAPECALPD